MSEPTRQEQTPPKLAAIDEGQYLTLDEAAQFLGIKRESVIQLMHRRHLQALPDPRDERRRLLLRSEVEARARYTKQFPRGRHPRDVVGRAAVPRGEGWLSHDERTLLLGLAGGALALGALVVLAKSEDRAVQAMALGVLVGLAVLVIAEMYKSGQIDAIEKRNLERIIADVEKHGDRLDELERIIAMGADSLLQPAS